jgi:hypothetical protein
LVGKGRANGGSMDVDFNDDALYVPYTFIFSPINSYLLKLNLVAVVLKISLTHPPLPMMR